MRVWDPGQLQRPGTVSWGMGVSVCVCVCEKVCLVGIKGCRPQLLGKGLTAHLATCS